MQNDSQEMESKPSSNKDLWLFLIVLDVIFLCVFGFFLYKHFSGQFVNQTSVAAVNTQSQEVDTPTVIEETVVTVESGMTAPAGQTVVPEPVEKPVSVEQPVPEVIADEAQPVVTTEKESVVVMPTTGKYRRVTFRWFGEGDKVSVVSGFTMSKPQALKKVGDHWETTLSIAPGTYKFLYIIDGKNTLDPYAPEQDGRSVLVVK